MSRPHAPAAPLLTVDELAARFGCTREQILQQYRTNIASISADLAKAEAQGRARLYNTTLSHVRANLARLRSVVDPTGPNA